MPENKNDYHHVYDICVQLGLKSEDLQFINMYFSVMCLLFMTNPENLFLYCVINNFDIYN